MYIFSFEESILKYKLTDLGLTRLTTQSLGDNHPISPISLVQKLIDLVISRLRAAGPRALRPLWPAALGRDITRSICYRTRERGGIGWLSPRERVVNHMISTVSQNHFFLIVSKCHHF